MILKPINMCECTSVCWGREVPKEWQLVLAGWLRWLEHRPVHQKVQFPVRAHCRFDPVRACTKGN